MNNLYLIVGPSGVGKTSVVEKLCKDYGYSPIESYTDRPPRYEGEKGHVFVTTTELNALEPFAYTKHDGFGYCVTKELIDKADLFVVDISGVLFLKEHYRGPKGIFVIGLTQDPFVLRRRMKKRGDSESTIAQRLASDTTAFADLYKHSDTFVQVSHIGATAEYINEFIQFHEREGVKTYE